MLFHGYYIDVGEIHLRRAVKQIASRSNFMSHVKKTEDDHWIWDNEDVTFRFKKITYKAAYWIFESNYNKKPTRFCKVPRCVNPEHMR